jgi:hypothetical protein
MFDFDDAFPPFTFSPTKSPSIHESAFSAFDLGAASPLTAPSPWIPDMPALPLAPVMPFRDVLARFEQEENAIPETRTPPPLNPPQHRRTLVMKPFVSLEATEITVHQLRAALH